ncbi:hypothetical protein LTH93_01675 [Nesterenkonia sp. DZ6]|nr:hypothetical protein [Nesterenkonia sp. DZ6]MCH8559400.1 hypothetical protein [Nesterenkonia sp. DZ6]
MADETVGVHVYVVSDFGIGIEHCPWADHGAFANEYPTADHGPVVDERVEASPLALQAFDYLSPELWFSNRTDHFVLGKRLVRPDRGDNPGLRLHKRRAVVDEDHVGRLSCSAGVEGVLKPIVDTTAESTRACYDDAALHGR